MQTEAIFKLSQAIIGALNLLADETDTNGVKIGKCDSLPNLLKQCITLCDNAMEKRSEPIRTVHHLSCTGGTLFAKCISAMPNVMLLNEVDPLSPIPFESRKPSFRPTDMISLLRQGDPNISNDFLVRLFTHDLSLLREQQAIIGRVLVLRDHSHSHFLTGGAVAIRPTLREIVEDSFPINSIVTVRDPVDSYLSMRAMGWHNQFAPANFEEYCRRYLLFLEKYKCVKIFKYEEFVADPQKWLRRICDVLLLDYTDKFTQTFGIFQLSGDSGRTGNVIQIRKKREVDGNFLQALKESASYRKLMQKLDYET